MMSCGLCNLGHSFLLSRSWIGNFRILMSWRTLCKQSGKIRQEKQSVNLSKPFTNDFRFACSEHVFNLFNLFAWHQCLSFKNDVVWGLRISRYRGLKDIIIKAFSYESSTSYSPFRRFCCRIQVRRRLAHEYFEYNICFRTFLKITVDSL